MWSMLQYLDTVSDELTFQFLVHIKFCNIVLNICKDKLKPRVNSTHFKSVFQVEICVNKEVMKNVKTDKEISF